MRASVLGAVVGLTLGCLFAAPVVRAQAPNQDVTQLVDDGLKLRSEGRDAEALERFETAYRSAKQPRILAQIALAEQALGRWSPAHVHLTEALSHRDDPWIKQWRTELEGTLARIDEELGRLEIVSNIPGATVLVEDRAVGIAPLAQPLRALPGTYSVRVQLQGYQPVTQRAEVQKGQTSRVEATLVRSEAAAAPAVAQAAPAQPEAPVTQPQTAQPEPEQVAVTPVSASAGETPFVMRKPFLIGAAGVAAGTFLLSAVTYGIAGKKARDYKDDDCGEGLCDDVSDRRSSIRTLDNTSRVFFGLGAATVVGVGVAYLIARQRHSEPSAPGVTMGAAVDRSSAVLQGTMEF